jgi:hypothetical protein
MSTTISQKRVATARTMRYFLRDGHSTIMYFAHTTVGNEAQVTNLRRSRKFASRHARHKRHEHKHCVLHQ